MANLPILYLPYGKTKSAAFELGVSEPVLRRALKGYFCEEASNFDRMMSLRKQVIEKYNPAVVPNEKIEG